MPQAFWVSKIIHIGRILAGVSAGVVKLALREHHMVTMELATEGNVEVSQLVYIGSRARVVGKPADHSGLCH